MTEQTKQARGWRKRQVEDDDIQDYVSDAEMRHTETIEHLLELLAIKDRQLYEKNCYIADLEKHLKLKAKEI